MTTNPFTKEELDLLERAPRIAFNSRNAVRITQDPNPLFEDLDPGEPAWLAAKRHQHEHLRTEGLKKKLERMRPADAVTREGSR